MRTDRSPYRPDQAAADELLGDNNPPLHLMRGNFVWDLPDVKSSGAAWRAVGLLINDWQLSGIWAGARRSSETSNSAAYTVGFSYQNGGSSTNLTGSPDYGARIKVIGDPGSGCSSDPVKQFNTTAFQGPAVGSVGLESGNSYLNGCFISKMDLAIARNIRLGGARNIQLRVDMFNAFNQSAITARNTTMNLTNPSDPITITNLPFDANGNLIDSRSRPRGAGFGVATGYQAPRTMQVQIRFLVLSPAVALAKADGCLQSRGRKGTIPSALLFLVSTSIHDHVQIPPDRTLARRRRRDDLRPELAGQPAVAAGRTEASATTRRRCRQTRR